MDKSKKDEELQSRREFFKNAAKGALPILGLIALSSVPMLSSAVEESPMGCRYGCAGACVSTCSGSCMGTCRGTCDSCTGSCKGTCNSACTGSCSGSCRNGCSGMNY